MWFASSTSTTSTTSTTVTPSDNAPPPQGYDGTSPFPSDEGPVPERGGGGRLYVTVTAVIVVLPFVTRNHDRATNLWPLALLSFGESWHNLHHADPTSARHGVDRGQLDPSAAFIRLLERLGWVSEVRWPTSARVAARRV